MLKNTVKSPGHPDYIFLGIVATLIVIGGLILVSVSSSASQEKFGSSFYYLEHQVLYGLLPGIILAFFVFKINLTLLKKWIPLLLLVNLLLMVMIFLPGVSFNFGGATRWINLGPISFQPSEFLKLTFILYLTSWLVSRITRHPPPKFGGGGRGYVEKKFSQTFIAFLIVIGLISLLLIFQPDISTLIIIISVATLLYFLADTPLWQNILVVLAALLILFLLINFAPYRRERIEVLFNPGEDPMGKGYQITQSLITAGSGGIFGVGLGMSQQKFGFSPQLPHSMSDSIFAIFSEEVGFIGSLILVLLYLSFFWRGFKIGKANQDKFSQLSAFGITFWITLQSFINIGSMIGILPLAGVPLPFISYGGSHLISELVGMGILLNISKNTS